MPLFHLLKWIQFIGNWLSKLGWMSRTIPMWKYLGFIALCNACYAFGLPQGVTDLLPYQVSWFLHTSVGIYLLLGCGHRAHTKLLDSYVGCYYLQQISDYYEGCTITTALSLPRYCLARPILVQTLHTIIRSAPGFSDC